MAGLKFKFYANSGVCKVKKDGQETNGGYKPYHNWTENPEPH